MSWLRSVFSFREQHEGDIEKPFLDHLEDLRWTLIKMGVTLGTGMGVAFCFNQRITEMLEAPLYHVEPATKLTSTVITDGFMISLSLSFYAGIVLSFPVLLYFVAGFVVPALTRKEKKMLFPGIAGGFVLFAGGVAICYHWILPKTLRWFHEYSTAHGYQILWTAKAYFAFVTHLCLACGLLCELPIVMVALSFVGVLSYGFLKTTRRYAVALILVLVAIIAPTPDPITFLTLALPMLMIFEGSIWLVWLIERARRRRELTGQTLGD